MKNWHYYIILIIAFNVNCQQSKNHKVEKVSKDTLENISSSNQPPISNSQTLPSEFILEKDSSTLVLIPHGYFIYGIDKVIRDSLLDVLSNPHFEIFEEEFPRSKQYLPSYYIDKYEITNKQYQMFIKETGHRKPLFLSNKLYNHPDQPVVGIGWQDATEYAKWAGKRLPTEEEWEKAARGTKGFFWPWGNGSSGDMYNGKSQGNYVSKSVGSFPLGKSPFGVQDMAGNVYEMTTGIWGTRKAMRGGSFLNSGAYTRTMFRWAMDDEINGAEWLGFRCVADSSIAISKK